MAYLVHLLRDWVVFAVYGFCMLVLWLVLVGDLQYVLVCRLGGLCCGGVVRLIVVFCGMLVAMFC